MTEPNHLLLPCPVGQVSDGYHTFDELYEHRCILFLAVMRSHPDLSWRARYHADGTMDPGWWIGGMELPAGQVTYHLPDHCWPLLDDSAVETRERAPEWDGHRPEEALKRLKQWLQKIH